MASSILSRINFMIFCFLGNFSRKQGKTSSSDKSTSLCQRQSFQVRIHKQNVFLPGLFAVIAV